MVEEIDLGSGHSFVWFRDSEGVFGLIEHHESAKSWCGGYIAWRAPVDENLTPKHELVSGGEDDVEHLTIAPSLQCRTCPSHGYIRDGRWVDA